MGDHEGWPQPLGLLPNEAGNAYRVLDGERWLKAEERTAELINCIQPNRPSEERRNAVANYVQRLIMSCFSCQVFTFGSVPLKTYLPDGDIDLTAFSKNDDLKDTWANEVRLVLENEERSENAEFRVKEVQYIQAEVKVIKCLVENIVVDISFNQVGGLCTLCFLEEIDHLINQNHLFKRSIILIKAWCYYESRILGAHHGLISTYALETLVLYIFHVFNNSFAGPLEVLYRFLEFFSKFDWENFCVSLCGPVPISSLPDISAGPPRKDGGELLLSKLFLEACSAVYAVLPAGQGNHGQQFVSKHFNVIDPLRSNNNLGRSVSKGNFYRIRSAFAFGAKRMSYLLDCPKEDLIAGVNQFFMNTLERHGSGSRPDAPASSLTFSNSSNSQSEEPNNSRGSASLKKNREITGLGTVVQPSHHAYRGNNPSTISHDRSQNSFSNQIYSAKGDLVERIANSSMPVKTQKNSRSDFSITDQKGQSMLQFSRTQSSPELTATSPDTQLRHNRVAESSKTHNEPSRSEYRSRRNYMSSESPSVQSTERSFEDPSILKQNFSHQSLGIASDSNNFSNSYHDDSVSTATGEELASVCEALESQQLEEQDLINMMASSQIHTFNGQFQLPMQFASANVLASMGYAQRNFPGKFPTNIILIDPSWGSSIHFPQGFVSSQPPHYFGNATANLDAEEDESATENFGMVQMSSEISDHDVGSTDGFETETGVPQTLLSDERKHPHVIGYNYMPSSRGNITGTSVLQGNQNLAVGNRGPRDYPDLFQHRTTKENEFSGSERKRNLRFFPTTPVSSSKIKPSSETSSDALNSKFSKSRDKWGRKPNVSAVASSLHGEAVSQWQFEGVSAQDDDESGAWVPISTALTNTEDNTLGFSTSTSPRSSNVLSRYDSAQTSPVAPMFVGRSRQTAVDNSGVFPVAFYPTGPPIPFLTMLPMYNFPADGVSSDGSVNRIDNVDRGELNHTCALENNFNSVESCNQSMGHLNLGTIKSESPETFEVIKTDILHSDFASHWQNLQYGRLCQNTPNNGPLIYSPPLMVPPAYLQGHFPLDGPGRPPATKVNIFPQFMGYGPRLVPVTSLQSVPSRSSNVFHRHGEEAPKYRGGTGTYLPNLKAPYRDRHFSSTRNHRGSYNYDRGDHNDREENWINSKARSYGRSHGRNQSERPSPRPDRSSGSDGRTERNHESYQAAPHQAHNSSFGSSPFRSANPAYGMHPPPGVGSNGVGPAGPYDQGVRYRSSHDVPEHGPHGPVYVTHGEVPRPGEGNRSRSHDRRHASAYRGGSARSSGDQASVPR
ncbi:hypothetical protein KSP40_PGU015463 [Platanthera guangdongensis]|uniref:Polymerase nucleotidyl transferase domain-containing protein n=1 Tax=Platanthera guangdongensis TaxID=2320717 RepID=A0ABR2MEN3_9ASPA